MMILEITNRKKSLITFDFAGHSTEIKDEDVPVPSHTVSQDPGLLPTPQL